ncbi:hypothetical protein QBC35DRAFT_380927 [Podospora australis]|uniref:Zn(2)-C6 fungal-type domain-containing protein n=1 Tax=Podospora australis TaxID=1536484 RepID=A0AAN7AHW0_9PEZI|nr:hypothetical protein QBC35DRAFT_380927 [Podospora australis]
MKDAAHLSPSTSVPARTSAPAPARIPGLTFASSQPRTSSSASGLHAQDDITATAIAAGTQLQLQQQQEQLRAAQRQIQEQQARLDHYQKYGALPEDPSIKRRAPLACRRCRRMRSKCHQIVKGQPPCQACIDSGLDAETCVFPVRGQPDRDREYRHPRTKGEKGKRDAKWHRRDILERPVNTTQSGVDEKSRDVWELLPPLDHLIMAINNFTAHYFQLGFIPKQAFPERLRHDQKSISPFFQLSILSIAARFTKPFVDRYGGPVQAAEVFMESATAMAVGEVYEEPNLERCQAFYLLSIAQQGSGIKHHSSLNMAIAMRMATLLQLHREETYALENPTAERVLQAESARRTLWMLHSQDNLHSGPRSPVLLSASDITALLPGDEVDFESSQQPTSRAALEDTQPAQENPRLVADPGRSLFAALIQAHDYWGAVSRRAMRNETSKRPWDPDSTYAQMATRLATWEDGLPDKYRWSTDNLRHYKEAGVDLGYLGVTMIPRLCNIVIRKAYLPEMLTHDETDPNLSEFWASMALELFRNVEDLFEQVYSQYSGREGNEGTGAQMAAFCVYTCGFLACYPYKYPSLCPESAVTPRAANMVEQVLNILDECKDVWPLASRWHSHLANFFDAKDVVEPGPEGSMADNPPFPPSYQHPVSPHQQRTVPFPPNTVTYSEKTGRSIHHPNRSHSPLLASPTQQPSFPREPQQQTPSSSFQAPVSPRQQHPPTSLRYQPAVSPQQPRPIPFSTYARSASAEEQRAQSVQPPAPRHQGLGLILEPFDPRRHAESTPTRGGIVTRSPAEHTFPAAGPTTARFPKQAHSSPLLPLNDGYENELIHFMTEGGHPTIQGFGAPLLVAAAA